MITVLIFILTLQFYFTKLLLTSSEYTHYIVLRRNAYKIRFKGDDSELKILKFSMMKEYQDGVRELNLLRRDEGQVVLMIQSLHEDTCT
jgi:hypothetical protein